MGMIEDLPHVPPALILLNEALKDCRSQREGRKIIRGMLSELRDQSESFEYESSLRSSDSHTSGRFEVHLHGALDLLSGAGCQQHKCRAAAANRIARSVGLIADRVWMTDLLTEKFVRFGRVTNEKIDRIIHDVSILQRLLPLIQAGVVRFRSPWVATCSSCAQHFQEEIANSALQVAKVFARDFKIQRDRGEPYVIDTGKSFEPPILLAGRDEESIPPNLRKFSTEFINEQLRSAFWIAREASLTGGSVFSNSRIGLAGLLSSEGRLISRKGFLLLEREREFTLPWVSDLSAQQILELRYEAADALPQLREKMARSMALTSDSSALKQEPSELIAELREQASEVRAELQAKQRSAAKYWKVTFNLLAFGCSAYGIAADRIDLSIGGLLSMIQLLINHKAGHEKDLSTLESKPGFVLLKAKDILAHAD